MSNPETLLPPLDTPMNGHLVSVTLSRYCGLYDRPVDVELYDVSVEGRGTVLCRLPKEIAQRAAGRLARARHIMAELQWIREKLSFLA